MNANAEAITERLFQRFLELYGRQWESAYGHVDGDAFSAWRDAIATMTTEQIKTGLDAVIAEGSEYPPNLIKFLRLCRTKSVAYHRPANLAALPPPNINRQPKVRVAKERHLKAMRELLGK